MEKAKAADIVRVGLVGANKYEEVIELPKFTYKVECTDKDGNIKWTEEVSNLVTIEGGNFLLDTIFKGSGYTAAWWMGVAGSGVKSATDALASHPSWVEIASVARKPITFGTTGVKANTAQAVSYSISVPATIAGAFICNVSSGTAGVLYSVSDFTIVRNVVGGDALNVTVTVSC